MNTMMDILNMVGKPRIDRSEEIVTTATAENNSGFHALTPEDIVVMKRMMGWQGGRQAWNILTGPVEIGRYVFVPLVSPEDVSYESNAMSHCIGDYYIDKMASGTSFNYSIRCLEGEDVVPMATMEISNHGRKYYFTQLKGINNTSVLPRDILDACVRFVNVDIENINMLKKEHVEHHKEAVATGEWELNICGYDWRDKENLKTVLDTYGEFFGKAYQKDLDALIETPFTREAVKVVNPLLKKVEAPKP